MDTLKSLIFKAKDLILKPKETWSAIAEEDMTDQHLLRNVLMLLAAVPAVGQFIGLWLFGKVIPYGGGVYRLTFFESLVNALIMFVLYVVGIWVLAKIINFLAPRFGAENSENKALKLAIFSAAPYFIAGALFVLPSLAVIVSLVGLYCLYLLYLGLPIVMNVQQEKSLAYTVVIVVATILISVLIGAISAPILYRFGPRIQGL